MIAELMSLLTTNDPRTIPYDDYRESVENTLLIFGETPPGGVLSTPIHDLHFFMIWLTTEVLTSK